jgi:hypothetical protein
LPAYLRSDKARVAGIGKELLKYIHTARLAGMSFSKISEMVNSKYTDDYVRHAKHYYEYARAWLHPEHADGGMPHEGWKPSPALAEKVKDYGQFEDADGYAGKYTNPNTLATYYVSHFYENAYEGTTSGSLL